MFQYIYILCIYRYMHYFTHIYIYYIYIYFFFIYYLWLSHLSYYLHTFFNRLSPCSLSCLGGLHFRCKRPRLQLWLHKFRSCWGLKLFKMDDLDGLKVNLNQVLPVVTHTWVFYLSDPFRGENVTSIWVIIQGHLEEAGKHLFLKKLIVNINFERSPSKKQLCRWTVECFVLLGGWRIYISQVVLHNSTACH